MQHIGHTSRPCNAFEPSVKTRVSSSPSHLLSFPCKKTVELLYLYKLAKLALLQLPFYEYTGLIPTTQFKAYLTYYIKYLPLGAVNTSHQVDFQHN